MYTDHHKITEYPFYAVFYHLGVDESLPLDEQKEIKIISFETICDISDRNNSINNDTITLYYPFNAEKEEIKVILGETVEVETYGLIQKGRVLGVYPSQMGGVTVLCYRI